MAASLNLAFSISPGLSEAWPWTSSHPSAVEFEHNCPCKHRVLSWETARSQNWVLNDGLSRSNSKKKIFFFLVLRHEQRPVLSPLRILERLLCFPLSPAESPPRMGKKKKSKIEMKPKPPCCSKEMNCVWIVKQTQRTI